MNSLKQKLKLKKLVQMINIKQSKTFNTSTMRLRKPLNPEKPVLRSC